MPITVLNINRTPVVEPIENFSLARGSTQSFVIRTADAEGNARTITAASEMPGFPLPSFIGFTDQGDGTGLFSLTPGVGDRGDHAIRVTVTDDGDGNPAERKSSDYVFIVTVRSDNEPPVIKHLGDVVVLPGQSLQLPLQVADLDQDAQLQRQRLPAGATLTPTNVYGTALLSWTPTAADLGTHDITVTVTDSGNGVAGRAESASRVVRVVVRNSNQTPVLVPIGDRQVAEGELLSFDLRAVDPDGDRPTLATTALPAGAVLDPASGRFSWRPALNQAGSYSITFAATDGQATSAETITITVANTNQLPVFVPLLPQLAREGAEISFSVRSRMPMPTRSRCQSSAACRRARCSCPRAANSSGRRATSRPAST